MKDQKASATESKDQEDIMNIRLYLLAVLATVLMPASPTLAEP